MAAIRRNWTCFSPTAVYHEYGRVSANHCIHVQVFDCSLCAYSVGRARQSRHFRGVRVVTLGRVRLKSLSYRFFFARDEISCGAVIMWLYLILFYKVTWISDNR